MGRLERISMLTLRDVLEFIKMSILIGLLMMFTENSEKLKANIDYYWPPTPSCTHYDSEVKWREMEDKLDHHFQGHMDIGREFHNYKQEHEQ